MAFFSGPKKKKKRTVESHSVYDPTIKLNLL